MAPTPAAKSSSDSALARALKHPAAETGSSAITISSSISELIAAADADADRRAHADKGHKAGFSATFATTGLFPTLFIAGKRSAAALSRICPRLYCGFKVNGWVLED